MKTRKGYQTYPLTIAQKFHFFYSDYAPSKAILNIGTSLTIEIDIDFDELKRSLNKACERCESMRVQFAFDKKENEWYQYVVDHEDRDFEFVDFSDKTMEEAESTMTKWTRIPFKQEDSLMNRIVMIKMPNGFQGIYFTGDHRLVDAQSLIMFFKDVIQLYCNAKFEGVPYPMDQGSYIEQLKKDLQYDMGCKAQDRDREYFNKLIDESEPIFNGWHGPQLLEETRKRDKNPKLRAAMMGDGSMDADIEVFHLEGEPTKRLMDFCFAQHISLQCLLIMGIRTYFQKFNDNDDVSICVAYARRATLSEKKSGGTRIHSYPFRTIISKDKTFMEGILDIRNAQNETFRHVNFNPAEYFGRRMQVYSVTPGYNYEPISLTYQPASLADKGLTELGDIRYTTKRYGNGLYNGSPYLTVSHRPEDNGLDFSFEYQLASVTKKDLEYFYYYLCKIMFKGVENPELTIGEIMELV